MRKGFTLLELIVVIIIIGILAILALTQYGRIIEKSRGAEAMSILGAIRTNAAAWRMENGNSMAGMLSANVGIGGAGLDYPNACNVVGLSEQHYFSYAISNIAANTVTITANRCTAGGKAPGGPNGASIVLNVNFAGADAVVKSNHYQ